MVVKHRLGRRSQLWTLFLLLLLSFGVLLKEQAYRELNRSKPISKETINPYPFSFTPALCTDPESVVPIIWKGPFTKKLVALTFDDGPTIHTEQILKILKRYRAKATFFVVGKMVLPFGPTLKRLVQEGNEIGNKMFSHIHPTALDSIAKGNYFPLEREIEKTQTLVYKATGQTPTLFRPPYFEITASLLVVLHQYKLPIILASVDPGVWDIDKRPWSTEQKSKEIIRRIKEAVHPGAIIILGEYVDAVREALPSILTLLHQRGYQCVTVSQLLHLMDPCTP